MNFIRSHQLTLGLSGGMLCGKSAALAAFKKCGAFALSCDELAREISARPAVRRQIERQFGSAEPKAVAAQAFADAKARKALEGLLHPLIEREIARRLQADQSPVRVVEVPLLFEAGWEKKFDLTLCIASPEKTLLARANKRGVEKTDFLKRSKAQWTLQAKALSADVCVLNGGSLAQLEGKIKRLYQALIHIYQAKQES